VLIVVFQEMDQPVEKVSAELIEKRVSLAV
jgi:hypothetical protein